MRVQEFRVRLAIALAQLIFLCACSIDSPLGPSKVRDLRATSATASAGVCDYNVTDASYTSTGWTRVFADDFLFTLSQWNVWYGGAFNNELELYQSANLTIDGDIGMLAINARRETVTGPTTPWDATPKTFSFTSGRLESKTLFSASRTTPRVRMSARLKLPAGYGMWPAFWSYGDPWPTDGEIDVMEARGTEPFQYQTNYFYGRRANVNLVQGAAKTIPSASSLTDCFHVYEVIWEKNSLTYLLDGSVVDAKTGGYISSFFGHTEKVVVNLAVGGNFFSSLDPSLVQPGTMFVDWVKVFTSK